MNEERERLKFNDIYTPLRNELVIILEKEEKAGLIIPEHLKEMKAYVEVAAVGPDVNNIEPGDFVVLRPKISAPTFNIGGIEYAQIDQYKIMGKLNKDLKDEFKSTDSLPEPVYTDPS